MPADPGQVQPPFPTPGPKSWQPEDWGGIDAGSQPQEWENPMWVPGRLGINPAVQDDKLAVEEASQRINLVQRRVGGLQVRPGQTIFATDPATPASVHTIQELNRVNPRDYTRYLGASNGGLWRGVGAIALIDTGYSGDPLCLCPFRPALSGDSWMVVADRNRIRQIPFAGGPIELGLPAPGAAIVGVLADILTTSICTFDSTAPAANAAQWVMTAGVDRSDDPVSADPPTAADVGPFFQGLAVEFTTAPGQATTGYSSIMGWNCPPGIDLTELQGGIVAASDDDIMHFRIRCNKPHFLEEFRVYLVCSTGFDATIIPGTDEAINTDAFVKAFRASDFTNFVEVLEDALAGGGTSRQNAVLTDYLGTDGGQLPSAEVIDATDPYGTEGSDQLPTQTSQQMIPGRNVWTEFGALGRPMRRGEFMRIGSTADRGWDTITGIILVIQTNAAEEVKVACDEWFLNGGFAPDTSEVTAVAYDWRYTQYDTETGDEGNPSPVADDADKLNLLRQRAVLHPPAFGRASVRQRFYRRGGSLFNDWFFVGENDSDGGEFVDDVGDVTASASGTVETDNHQPVPTFDDDGTTLLAQPVPVVFEIDGQLFGLGDKYRPGHLYRSKPGRPGSWPPDFVNEVCPPSEELMTGTTAQNAGAIIFSRERAFQVLANITQNGDVATPEIPGAPGIAQRWAWTAGPGGVYYVSRFGIYRTNGGSAELVAPKLRPIFESGTPLYPKIDWTAAKPIFLDCAENRLRLQYTDVGATVRTLVIDLLTEEIYEEQYGRTPYRFHYDWGGDGRVAQLFIGGTANGTVYTNTGFTDDGVQIPYTCRTGYNDAGRPREDKHLGDVVMDAELAVGAQFSLQVLLNNGEVVNTAAVVDGVGTRNRYMFDPFGIIPQFARNMQLLITGTAPTTSTPVFYLLGASYASLPDQTLKRATQWQPIGDAEAWVKGCTIVCDTDDQTITVLAEGTRTGLGDPFTFSPLLVRANGKRLLQFSWAAVRAEQVRLRPTTDCGPWRLFRVSWQHTPEPPRIGFWDTVDENLHDSYLTGIDLEVNTFGVEKIVQIEVDGVALTNRATGTTSFPITTTRRQLVHLTFENTTPIRGHLLRILSVDGVEGMLYSWTIHKEQEPSEQTNWNQNYTIEATMGDKAIKGVLLEFDTFGQTKTVRVEVDGVLHTTIAPSASGRLVENFTWPSAIGRVLRIQPSDAFPSRLYSYQWIYDEEPLKLQRWETQLLNLGAAGRKAIYHMETAYKSNVAVTLTVLVYNTAGLLLQTLVYPLPALADVKQIQHVMFDSNAGWLYKFVWTGDELGANGGRFWLYRPETVLDFLPWGGELTSINPFGDDDLDKVRSLSRASAIAASSGDIRASNQ
jgi:hypothetical protein